MKSEQQLTNAFGVIRQMLWITVEIHDDKHAHSPVFDVQQIRVNTTWRKTLAMKGKSWCAKEYPKLYRKTYVDHADFHEKIPPNHMLINVTPRKGTWVKSLTEIKIFCCEGNAVISLNGRLLYIWLSCHSDRTTSTIDLSTGTSPRWDEHEIYPIPARNLRPKYSPGISL